MENEHYVACALFDLQKFTTFSNQVDLNQLNKFASLFHNWILDAIVYFDKNHKTGLSEYELRPDFVKSTGDGLIILWNLSNLNKETKSKIKKNIIPLLSDILILYNNPGTFRNTKPIPKKLKFVEYNKNKFNATLPNKLRCGLSFGNVRRIVYSKSLSLSYDFIGHCINLAARLESSSKKNNRISLCCDASDILYTKVELKQYRLKYSKRKLNSYDKSLKVIIPL